MWWPSWQERSQLKTTLDQDEITSDNIYFGESEGEITELVIDMDKDDGQNAEECNDLKSELNMPVKTSTVQMRVLSG